MAKRAEGQIVFQGVCIYQGKTPMPDKVPAALADLLKKRLQAKASDGFELAVGAIERSEPGARNAEESDRRRLRRLRLQPDRLRRQGRLLREAPLVPAGQGRTSAS